MCVSPLTIKSNSRRYRPSLSRLTLDVPCGHCCECISHAQDEWFLRIWQEIQDCNAAGGKVVFMTLTYDNKHLPIFTDIDEDTGECYEVPCFDKTHKDRFLANLRDYFRKTHGFSVKRSQGIRFMWSSEYGMTEGLSRRSHYHLLLFFPKEFVDVFENKTEFANTLKHFWDYGFSYFSKECDGGMFVQSEFAGAYVSKYMCKDVDFFGRPDVQSYLYNEDGTKNMLHWQKFKDCRPKHWQSKHFGESLVQYCNNDNVFVDGLDLNFVKDIRLATKKKYKVPRYIERKVLRELDEFGSLVLNDRGKRVYKQVDGFDSKFNRMLQHNSDLLAIDNLSKLCFGDLSRAMQIRNRLLYINNGRSPDILASYILVFRGLVLGNPVLDKSKDKNIYKPPSYVPPDVFSVEKFDRKKFLDCARMLFDQKVDGFSFMEPFFVDGYLNYYEQKGSCTSKMNFRYEKFSKTFEIYDKFPIFAGYSEFLKIIFDLKKEYREKCFLRYQLERQSRTKYKLSLTA